MVWSRQSVDVPYCDRADVEHVTTAVVDMAKCHACGFGF
jgi:hypothetical protein